MPTFFRAAGITGSILVILALIITLLKKIIAFIGIITTIIKVSVVLVFVILFIGVALMMFRTWNENRRKKE